MSNLHQVAAHHAADAWLSGPSLDRHLQPDEFDEPSDETLADARRQLTDEFDTNYDECGLGAVDDHCCPERRELHVFARANRQDFAEIGRRYIAMTDKALREFINEDDRDIERARLLHESAIEVAELNRADV